MELEDQIQAMAGEAEFASSGVFTVDWGQAEREREALCRAIPETWVVKLIQGAVASQAKLVCLSIGFFRIQFSFWSRNEPVRSIDAGQTQESARYFFQGIRAALAGVPYLKRLGFATFGPGQDWAMLYWQQPDGPPRQVMMPSSDLPTMAQANREEGYVWSLILDRQGWWPKLLVAQQKLLSTVLGLKKRLQYCPTLVRVLPAYGMGLHSDQFEMLDKKENGGTFASEQILGPVDDDIFVPQREPGWGATLYDIFGETLEMPEGGLLTRRKPMLSRWSETDSPPFTAAANRVCTDVVREKQAAEFGSFTRQGLPLGAVPLYSQSGLFSHPREGYALLHPDYRIPTRMEGFFDFGDAYQFYALPCRVVVRLQSLEPGPGELKLLRRGVIMETLAVDLGSARCQVLAACPALKMDLADTRFLQDEVFEQLLNFLRERVGRLRQDCLEGGIG